MKPLTDFFIKNKIVAEAAIAIALVAGGYYGISLFMGSGEITVVETNEQLLGQNFVLFLKAVNQDHVSLTDRSFLSNPLIAELQDFTEIIPPTTERGRADPFIPYASSRPLR